MLRRKLSNIIMAVLLAITSFAINVVKADKTWAEESRIDVASITQDGVALVEVDGFYEVPDYSKPIDVTFLAKELKLGYNYNYNASGQSTQGEMYTPTEEGENREYSVSVMPSLQSETSTIYFSIYGYQPSQTLGSPMLMDNLYTSIQYRITDERYSAFNTLVLESLSQGGNTLTPSCVDEDLRHTCTYTVNDIQTLSAKMHATQAIDEAEYSISGYMFGDFWAGNANVTTFTGAELKAGVSLDIPLVIDKFGTPRLDINYVTGSASSGLMIKNSDDVDYSSEIILDIRKDESIPRFSSELAYKNYPEVKIDNATGRISPLYHDAENPLMVKISGEGYADDETYEVTFDVRRDDEQVAHYAVPMTGAELNRGTTFALDGLAMNFPTVEEFSQNSESAYYSISVAIDDLTRQMGGYYDYGSNVSSVVVTSDGAPIVSVGGGGAGGPRISMESSTVARSLVESETGVNIYYVTSDYDNASVLDYEVYVGETDQRGFFFNSLPEDFVLVSSGKVSGKELNSGTFKVNFKNSERYVRPAVITLFKSNGRMVSEISDFIEMWDGAGIVSGELHTKESGTEMYMQMMSQSYYVPKGNSVKIRYNGVNFEENKMYSITQQYGYVQQCATEKPEGINAWSNLISGEYCWQERSDNGELVEDIEISGKDLNEGKLEIELPYSEKLEKAHDVMMSFTVSDSEREYNGAYIYLTYVDGNDLFTNGKGYKIDNLSSRISGISEKTQVSAFVGEMKVNEGGDVVVFSGDTKLGDNANIGTNMKVEFVDEYERPLLDVTAVVNGDLTGSGEINSADLLKMRRHLISGEELDGAFLEAADVIANDKIDSTDLLQMRKHLIGTAEIK